jgi:hypothetical protein
MFVFWIRIGMNGMQLDELFGSRYLDYATLFGPHSLLYAFTDHARLTSLPQCRYCQYLCIRTNYTNIHLRRSLSLPLSLPY